MKVITIGTLKGGTGKTSTCFNLSGILAEKSKVLLLDMDAQTNLSFDVGIDVTAKNLKTVRNIFEDDAMPESLIIKSPLKELPNIDIIPSSILLAETALNIISVAGRERILTNFINDNIGFLNQYDYIIIDTNPSMDIINQNAFLAADSVVLVSDVSANGIQGAEAFMALWEKVRRQLRCKDNVSALIINNYDKRIKLAGELLEFCSDNEEISKILLRTVIPSSVKVKETELEHRPINILHTNSNVHEAFKNIISELENKGVL